MKTKILLNNTLWIFLLVSCNQPVALQDNLPQIELENIEVISTPYTIVKIVPLETNENNLLGDYLTVKFTETAYYIFDQERRDAIYVFDRRGNFQGKSVEVGEGPGMVAHISDFMPTPEGVEILNALGDQAQIIRFDTNREINENLNLDYYGSSFTKMPNGYYLVSGGYNLPLVENRLAIIDGQGETLKEFLPNKHKILAAQEQNFSSNNGTVFFHEIYNNTAYKVLEDSLTSQYQLDFGKYRIPERFFEMD